MKQLLLLLCCLSILPGWGQNTAGPAGPVIVVCAHDPVQLAAAAEELKQQGHINAQQPLTLLE